MRADPTRQLIARLDAHPIFRKAEAGAFGDALIVRQLYLVLCETWLVDRLAGALAGGGFAPAPQGFARQTALALQATLQAAMGPDSGLVSKFDRLTALACAQGLRVDQILTLARVAGEVGAEKALQLVDAPFSCRTLILAWLKLGQDHKPHTLAGLVSVIRELELASAARAPLRSGWASEAVCARPIDEPRRLLRLVKDLVGADAERARQTEDAISEALSAFLLYLDEAEAEIVAEVGDTSELDALKHENRALHDDLALLKRAILALAARAASSGEGPAPFPG